MNKSDKLDQYFAIRARGSTLVTELVAGISTFLAMSYIVVVNPAILQVAGIPPAAVFFATVVVSGLATLFMGLWARLPYALAPGMEMNAYVAYFVVGVMGLGWQEALGAVFWSGVIFLILTATRVRQRIIEAIPDRLTVGLSLSVGVFLILVAMRVAGLLRYEGVRLTGFGDWGTTSALLLVAGLAFALLFERLRLRGAVLFSILLTAGLAHLMNAADTAPVTVAWSSDLFDAVGQFDLTVIMRPTVWPVILVLFLIDFYGSIAKFLGLARHTTLMVGGQLPDMNKALWIDGAAVVAGAATGTSSVLVYVESGVGIGAGGRTGITAIIVALGFFACFLVTPLLQYIPTIATVGCLAFVGMKLCPPLRDLRQYPPSELLTLSLMQITVIATFAIDRALLVGMVMYILADLRQYRRPNGWLLLSAGLLLMGVMAQLFS